MMKKHKVLRFALAVTACCCCYACNDTPDWDSAQKGVEMDITEKKLSLDIQNSKLNGLLQEGTTPDPQTTGYNIHFLHGYGKTVTITIQTETTGWGVTFKPITKVFAPTESGINWPGESGNGYVFVPIEEEIIPGRANDGPLRNGSMPLNILVKDNAGNLILSQRVSVTVYDKNKVLKTVSEMNEDWKLSIGDALFYVPKSANAEAQNKNNKLVIYAHFGSTLISDFEGTGLTASEVTLGTNIADVLQLNQYIAVDNVTGIFWQSPSNPFSDDASGITWNRQVGAARIFDYRTGNSIDETQTFCAYISGANAKSTTNTQANNGLDWYSCVLDGLGDERLIDIKKTSATWNIGVVGTTTFDKEGTYILQWDLLNKRPGNNPSIPLTVVGKLRAIVQVVKKP